MTRDLPQDQTRKPPAPGRLVVTGVVGACVLGVGLGFWARPATPGESAKPSAPRATAPAEPARPSLRIVLEEAPAPVGGRLEVLPADVRATEPAPAPPMPVEPMVPRRAASGLVKVDAVVLAEPEPATAVIHAPPKSPDEAPQALKLIIAEPPRPDPKPARPKPDKARIAETKVAEAKVAAAKIAANRAAEAKARKAAELARAEKSEQAKAAKLARQEKQAKAEKLEQARLEKVQLAKVQLAKALADKAKAVKLAKAEAQRERAQAERLAKAEKTARAEKAAKIEKAKADAKSRRLLALLRAAKTEARQPARPKAVKVAAVKPAPKPPVVTPARKPAPKPPALRGSGPMRVARANACASPDPGEAAVCADQRLGARDRQLQQAYRNAEAAGVPVLALRVQQARWLQARAAAAREAPWAVEDVYVARISELKDQTRDAREN